MKRLFRASLILTASGLLIFASQMSCTKTVAQTSPAPTTQNLVLIVKSVQVAGTPVSDSGRVSQTTVSENQYWLAGLDGSNYHQIPVTLPSGLYVGGPAYLTHDGGTLVFAVSNQSQTARSIYSCKTDGSGLQKVMDTETGVGLSGAY